MPAFASDAPPSNAFLQSEPAQRQFLLKSSRAIAPGVLLSETLFQRSTRWTVFNLL